MYVLITKNPLATATALLVLKCQRIEKLILCIWRHRRANL
jgi:hypothetical protein